MEAAAPPARRYTFGGSRASGSAGGGGGSGGGVGDLLGGMEEEAERPDESFKESLEQALLWPAVDNTMDV